MASRKCTWGEEIQARAVGRQLWQCAVITGKSRMTNSADSRDGKSLWRHLAITYRDEINERIWMVGDIVIVFEHFPSPGQILWMVGQGGLAFALHRGTAANPD